MINRDGGMERDFISMNNKKSRLIKSINNGIFVVLWTEGTLAFSDHC